MEKAKKNDLMLKAVEASIIRYTAITSGEIIPESDADEEICDELCTNKVGIDFDDEKEICPCCQVSRRIGYNYSLDKCADYCFVGKAIGQKLVAGISGDDNRPCLKSFYDEDYNQVLKDLQTVSEWAKEEQNGKN